MTNMQYTAPFTADLLPDERTRDERRAAFLASLGAAVRARRTACGLTLRALAKRAGVSERFLVQLETGEGNISVVRLQDVAEALQISSAELLSKADGGRPSPHRIVALLGLRGAGKSTVGAAVARETGVPFLELDAMVASAAGMSLSTLFEIHGEAHFRRLEREALRQVLQEGKPVILATGGSIVKAEDTFALLKKNTCTVWLKASAPEHWARVVGQGDMRPMSNRANAMSELRLLLSSRKVLYSQADYTVDTSGTSLREVTQRVLDVLDKDRAKFSVPASRGALSSQGSSSAPSKLSPPSTKTKKEAATASKRTVKQ